MAKRLNGKEVTKPRTTRGQSGAAATREFEEAENADEVEFNAEKFLEHVDNVSSLNSKRAEIRGKIGAAVKNAEEDYGVHRGAASLMIKLKGQSEEQRAAFFKAFDDMRTALGWANQSDLFTGANTPAERATFAGRATS